MNCKRALCMCSSIPAIRNTLADNYLDAASPRGLGSRFAARGPRVVCMAPLAEALVVEVGIDGCLLDDLLKELVTSSLAARTGGPAASVDRSIVWRGGKLWIVTMQNNDNLLTVMNIHA